MAFETLLQIAIKSRTVLPRMGADSCKNHRSSCCWSIGFQNVTKQRRWESNIGNVRITGLPFFGEHADLDIRSKMRWVGNIWASLLQYIVRSCKYRAGLLSIPPGQWGCGCVVSGYRVRRAHLPGYYGPRSRRLWRDGWTSRRRLSGFQLRQAEASPELSDAKRYTCMHGDKSRGSLHHEIN